MPQLTLRDGRMLGYSHYGVRRGCPLFYFHGLPGSRREALLVDQSARTLGAWLIAPDRPGYGLSTFQPQRRLRDWPGDVVQLADALEVDRFGLLGNSGGGPYALVCAHALADRITCAGLVGSLGPLSESGLRRSMRWLPRSALYLAAKAPSLLDIVYGRPLTWLIGSGLSLPLRLLAYRIGEPDKSVILRPEILEELMQSVREAFRQGPQGARQDARILNDHWGFRLQQIRTLVHLWHGDADTVVPLRHAEYLDARLPHSQLTIAPGEGHFSLPVDHRVAIVKTLLDAGA